MTRNEKIMNAPPLKALIIMGIPSILIQLLDELNGIIDAIFMGHFFGSEAVASMSVILPVMILLISLALLFSSGAKIAIGRYLGARETSKASWVAANTFAAIVITGFIMGVIGYFITPHFLSLYQLTEKTYNFANQYLRLVCLGLPIMMISMFLNELIYTQGHAKASFLSTLLQLVLNVLFNYIAVVIFKSGVSGIVIGTLLSIVVQIIAMFMVVNSEKMVLKIRPRDIKINLEYFKEILQLGLPAFFSSILMSVTLGLESNVIADFGPDALSVQTITGYIFSATSSVATGILAAALVLLSYSTGAKDIKRFKKTLNLTLVFVFTSCTLLNLPMILNSGMVSKIFTDSIDVINLMKIPALVYGITAPFIFVTNVYLYAMEPMGMAKTATWIFALQQCVFFIPLLFILKNYGFIYAISAQPVSEIIGAVITLFIIPTFYRKLRARFLKTRGAGVSD